MAKVKRDVIWGVYAILFNGIIIYIGSSNDTFLRFNQHRKLLISGKHIKGLQKFFDENVKDVNLLEFKVIHQTQSDNKLRLFMAEMVLIMANHDTIFNRAVIQLGLKFVNFSRTEWDLEILKYI